MDIVMKATTTRATLGGLQIAMFSQLPRFLVNHYSCTFVIIQNKADGLDDKPSNLEELKCVLRTISNIRDVTADVETSIRDVVERYRLLVVYKLLVSSQA